MLEASVVLSCLLTPLNLRRAKRERIVRQDAYVSTRRQSLGRRHLDNAATYSGTSTSFSRTSASSHRHVGHADRASPHQTTQHTPFDDYDASRYEYPRTRGAETGAFSESHADIEGEESVESLERRVQRLTEQSEHLHAALRDELDASMRD